MIMKSYCGYIKDETKLTQSSSGGLATAMAEKIIDGGNIVYGVSYSSDFKQAKYIKVCNRKDLELLKGSKYIKAPLTKEILGLITSDLNSGKTVLFIGLPCDVNALKSFISKNNTNDSALICVDLICHGTTTNNVAQQYIEKLEKKYKATIKAFSVKYKNPYWKPQYLFVSFKNGKKYIKEFYKTDYGVAFLKMSRKTCYSCNSKGENRKSDMTIGDFWGSQSDDEGYNKYGSSIAFIHTEKAETFIKSLNNFALFPADTDKALKSNKMYSVPTELTTEKIIFKENFDKKGLRYAVSKVLNLRQKIIRKTPEFIFRLLKKKKF